MTSDSHAQIPRSLWLGGLVSLGLISCFPLLFIALNGVNVPFHDELQFRSLRPPTDIPPGLSRITIYPHVDQ
jgi:hypothetical protein